MLLCPHGSGVNYINHNQTLADVKVQWSQDGITGHNSTWLDKSPEEFLLTHKARLALDYIAIKDIQAGEELFLDYGDLWEEAWQDHIRDWKPEHSSWSYTYLSAKQWNAKFDTFPLRTESEAIPADVTYALPCRHRRSVQRRIYEKRSTYVDTGRTET